MSDGDQPRRRCGCSFGQGCRTQCVECFFGGHWGCQTAACQCRHSCISPANDFRDRYPDEEET